MSVTKTQLTRAGGLLIGLLMLLALLPMVQISGAEASTTLPTPWGCSSQNPSNCLNFSGYRSVTHPGTGVPDSKAFGQYRCGSGNNCVHYVAWRVFNETKKLDPTYTGAGNFVQACHIGSNAQSWDTRARACGLTVSQGVPSAGDILHFDGYQRINGHGASGIEGHVAFIDHVEPISGGDFRLYISDSGCGGYEGRRTVNLSQVQATGSNTNSNVEIIHVPYPGKNQLIRDYNSDGKDDIYAARANGELLLYPGNGSGGFHSSVSVGGGWQNMLHLVNAGDFDGDGNADLIAVAPNGDLRLYPGKGTGGFKAAVKIGSGWTNMSHLISPGDFNGDGKNDLIAVTSSGELRLYPGTGNTGTATFAGAIKIGHGWQVMQHVTSSGDLDGDGNPDLLAINGAGQLLIYRGNGSLGFSGSNVVGGGWQNTLHLVGVGDLNSDGRNDLLGIDANGNLKFYPGTGTGSFSSSVQVGPNWENMKFVE